MKVTSAEKHALLLPDNRTLTWYESGPSDGQPVLFCTGAGMSGLLSMDAELLTKLNIRLITPTRPGLGESTFDPKKTLKSFSSDVLFLLAYLNIKNISVIGSSQGAVFAMAICYYGKVDKLAIVAGQDQLDYPEIKKLLSSDVVNMQQQALFDPDGLKIWIIENITIDWLMDFILNYSADVDLALYQENKFFPVYQACMKEAFKYGNKGYAQDLLITMQHWGFTPEMISTPTTLWYGLKDTSTVHSPDFGKLLSQRFPHAQRYVYDNEGGSLLWTKTSQILTNLIS
ncbi:TPA: alpha/beta hydrolase [Proteus mirabilis]|uniref:alpha/beta fold hydrolase n=1 Tax=Proteus mirabilis TaxID=584 RepID=UPI0005367605|nr:alpha/beta hydrolase [Proteus mirabilis]AUT92134.1 alpha/beta hydrolase [Proteus mirabilis]MBG2729017.1 alpha/beta hydrolase [Proteus mirabilis]MBG2781865.1 alpha/beta hydrolase [Proteus mirabilis]MBG2893404.1 alpha/beta hydrolase [Proteus mirabilis]MBG2954464.1 alpha/beta hydrolase [Proteus mirabilis]